MKQIEKAYVFRLYPTEKQATLISKAIGCARFVYNYFLARRSAHYKETGETLGYQQMFRGIDPCSNRTRITSG